MKMTERETVSVPQPTDGSGPTLLNPHARNSLTLAPLRLAVVSFHSSTNFYTESLHSTR